MRTRQRGVGFVKPGKVSANGLSLDWIDARFLPLAVAAAIRNHRHVSPSDDDGPVTPVMDDRITHADFGHYA
jgi:hypothetical protein